MATPDQDLSTPEDRALRAALTDAAADVTPADRLGEVRRRTAAAPPTRSGRRRWLPVVAGAGALTAAVVAASVGLGDLGTPADPPTAGSGDGSAESGLSAAAVYFVSDSATGDRLYREFASVPATGGSAAVLGALRAITADPGPADPDYRTWWPADSFADAVVSDDEVVVEVADAALNRPDGASAEQARLGLQQAVYTAEAALGRTIPVRFEHGGAAAGRVLGVRVTDLVPRDTRYRVTAPVNLSSPVEGAEVRGTFRASGTIASYIDRVQWRLTDARGRVVRRGQSLRDPAGGPDGTPNSPGWATEPIDVSTLGSGTYRFTAQVRDNGKLTSVRARFSDDRDVVVP